MDIEGLIVAFSQAPTLVDDAEAFERMNQAERLKAAITAYQVRETDAAIDRRFVTEKAAGVPAHRRCRGFGAEIALARQESPSRGSRFAKFAQVLMREMPCTFRALEAGEISEEKARAVFREIAWLPSHLRHSIDAQLQELFSGTGLKRLAGEARRMAQHADPAATVEHMEYEERQRHISVRPAPGNMAYLTAFVPMPQAVAAYAALQKAASVMVGTGESGERTGAQMAADLFITRLTGQEAATDISVEIQLIMTDEALISDGTIPAWLPGHGPLPAAFTRRLLQNTSGAVYLRRLFTQPETGQLVAMDSKRRTFNDGLRRMVICRDDVCRSPWCDAPIRHIDHATPHAAGGATSWVNASGLCAACNYAKENPGWRHTATPDALTVRTPSGQEYTSRTIPITSPAKSPVAKDPEATASQARGEKRGRDGRHRDGPRTKVPAGGGASTDASTGASASASAGAGASEGEASAQLSLVESSMLNLIIDLPAA